MSVLKIDLNTGAKTGDIILVSCFSLSLFHFRVTEILTSFNTYGEITRSFIFAPSLAAFLLPQADFLSPPDLNVSLWRIGENSKKERLFFQQFCFN